MKNSSFVSGEGFVKLKLTVTASGSAGDIDLISTMPILLITDANASDLATAEILGCKRVIAIDVHGANNAGDTAVAIGDKVYWDSTEVNADVTNGTFLGYALAAVVSGATTEIDIALVG